MASSISDVKQAAKVIRSGGQLEARSLSFDINSVHTKKTYDFHDSNNYENELTYITSRTLLHIAIESKNIFMVTALLNSGADPTISIEKTTHRKQRMAKSGSGMWGTADWGDWTEWSPEIETITTKMLAEKCGVPEIMQKFNSWLAPEEDKEASKDSVKSESSVAAARKGKKSLQSSRKGKEKAQEDSTKEIDELDEELDKKSTIDRYKNKVVKSTIVSNGRKISIYGFPNKDSVKQTEKTWQQKVSQRFFRMDRALKDDTPSSRIYRDIEEQLKSKSETPINIDALNRRSFMVALVKLLAHHGEMPELKFKLGITIIRFTRESSFTERQKGNFTMDVPGLGEYPIAYGNGAITRLKYLVHAKWDTVNDSKNRYKQLRDLIKRKLNTLTPFTYQEFNKYGNTKIALDKTSADPNDNKVHEKIHFLNGLIFLITIVEVLVRSYRTKEGHIYDYGDKKEAMESDSLPIAMAQSRSLFLLLNGRIKFNDFIGQSTEKDYDDEQHRAKYGMVTGKNTISNIDIMLDKLFSINELYNELIPKKESWTAFCADYKKSNPNSYFVEGRSRMYKDLTTIYGDGNESSTDSAGYSSEEDSGLDDVIRYVP